MMSTGSIHGRFQPFHNAHLAYALAALQQVEVLYVGLTRVLQEIEIAKDLAPHRFKDEENPLSFSQRAEVVSRALLDAGVPQSRFNVGPFPIEVPTRLPEFWPLTAPCFTTNVADWNQRKIDILTDLGYLVLVLDLDLTGMTVTTGSTIRQLFREGDASWLNYVPTGTAACIIENHWLL